MKIDLFELIEGLFEGTLYFLYNILATAGTLLAHPVDGPHRLVCKRAAARAEQDARAAKKAGEAKPPARGAQQVGGLTFIFVWFFAFYLASDILPGGKMGLPALARLVSSAGGIDVAPIWPSVVGALAAAALADVALRLLILLFIEPDPAARDEMVNRAEYAFFWPMLAVLALTSLLTWIMSLLGGRFPDWLTGAMFAFLAAMVAAYLPVVLQIWPGLGPAAARPWRHAGSIVGLLAAVALLMGILAGTFIAGLNIANAVHARAEAPAPAAPAAAPTA